MRYLKLLVRANDQPDRQPYIIYVPILLGARRDVTTKYSILQELEEYEAEY